MLTLEKFEEASEKVKEVAEGLVYRDFMTVGLLLDRHLIEECGRLQVPGRPRLYRTTKAFLRAFHLNSLDDLPEIPGLEADGQLRLDDDGAVQEPEQ